MDWEFVHGLFENAVYGGRVDNTFDVRVLSTYLRQYFDNEIISDSVMLECLYLSLVILVHK